jgi:hypothetical protein
MRLIIVGGVSAAVSKTAAAPIERVKLLIQNQVRLHYSPWLKPRLTARFWYPSNLTFFLCTG